MGDNGTVDRVMRRLSSLRGVTPFTDVEKARELAVALDTLERADPVPPYAGVLLGMSATAAVALTALTRRAILDHPDHRVRAVALRVALLRTMWVAREGVAVREHIRAHGHVPALAVTPTDVAGLVAQCGVAAAVVGRTRSWPVAIAAAVGLGAAKAAYAADPQAVTALIRRINARMTVAGSR